MIEQVPAETIVTALPETVQTDVVPEVNVTGSPELAVAPIAIGVVPTPCVDMAPKLMS